MQSGSEKMHRLIHWFFDCYEYHLRGIDIRGLSSKKRPLTSDLHLAKAKEFLKRQYIKYTGLNLKEYTPFSNLKTSLQGQIKDIRNLNITEDEKLEKELELIEESAIKEIQYLLLKLEGTFTTALSTFSYEGQKRLIKFLFDYFMENEIPIWKQMHELIKQQEMRTWVYWMLKKKACVISGKLAQLAHDKSAGSIGGYKYDGLIGNTYLPLAPQFHMGIDHGVGGEINKKNISASWKSIWERIGDCKMKKLSAREKEVLDLTETGYTQNQIAIKLSITRNAVKSYLKRVCYKKVGGKTIAKNNK